MPKTVEATRFSFRQLLELDACTRCGECVKWCPTFTEKQELDEITPLRKIERTRSFLRAQALGPLGRLFGYQRATEETLQMFSAGTYDCTLCGRCAVVCPVNIDTRSLWIAMREQLVDMEYHPEIMNTMRDAISGSYNISGDANEDRLIWSENLPTIPEGVKGKEQAEVVYFVGCVSSFYPQSYSIPQSFVEILDKAKVDFLTMGEAEQCCGFPLIVAGMGDSARALVQHNVEAVRKTGAKTLVASCPSCYHTWHSDYPRLIGEPLGFQVLHSTEFLRDVITDGRIRLGSFGQPVTYHDPCDLGRSSGIYDAPRQIIGAIPDVEFAEMKETREYSLCCGGGGDVEMADSDLSASVARRRLEQAQATEAKVILSACQQCVRTLAGAARREKIRIRSMDIVELVAKVIEA
ncbi:MAG: (Fe-S)-binding protein [Chloroflexi bacterium]|nr:(Fe-S)-binding protein [Chloroflexota bacterium]